MLFQTPLKSESVDVVNEKFHRHLGFKIINEAEYIFAPIQSEKKIKDQLSDFHSSFSIHDKNFFLDNNLNFEDEPKLAYDNLFFVFSDPRNPYLVEKCLSSIRFLWTRSGHLDFIKPSLKENTNIFLANSQAQKKIFYDIKEKTFLDRLYHRVGIIDNSTIFFSDFFPKNNETKSDQTSNVRILIIPIEANMLQTQGDELVLQTNFNLNLDYNFILSTGWNLRRKKFSPNIKEIKNERQESTILIDIDETLRNASSFSKIQLFLYTSKNEVKDATDTSIAWWLEKQKRSLRYMVSSNKVNYQSKTTVFMIKLRKAIQKDEIQNSFSFFLRENDDDFCRGYIMDKLKFISFHSQATKSDS